MEKLFEDKVRTFLGPANHNENSYDYFDRSARNDISVTRNMLNDWFSNYPASERKELKNSFKKKFDDCFFELFLYQLFSNLGFTIEVHPALAHTSKKPDFLIKKGDLEIYIEAKIVKDKSVEQEGIEKKINEFYDNFSKLDSKGFLLNLSQFNLKSSRQPSTKGIIRHIENEIDKYDPDEVTKVLEEKGADAMPIITYENKDLEVEVKLIPVIPSARKIKKKPIGIYPFDTFWGGGEKSLKESIRYKAKRYGKLEKPFIVCLNSLDIKTSGKIDVDNSIWGSLAWSWSTNPENRDEKWVREQNGVFLEKGEPKLENLSGIFVTKVNPFNIHVAKYWLYKHPFSKNNLDFECLGLVYSYVNDGKIISHEGNNLYEIFNLEKG